MFSSVTVRGCRPSRMAAFSAGQPERRSPSGAARGSGAAAQVRDDVAERVVQDVTHVQLARRYGHLEHVGLELVVGLRRVRVRDRARSRSQTSCHLASIFSGSYRSNMSP